MGASPAQVAAARALAKSRGYDPNLVDADNADRANSAFPVQNHPSVAPLPPTNPAPSAPAQAPKAASIPPPPTAAPAPSPPMAGLQSVASTLAGPGGVSGATPNGTGAKLDSTPPSGAPAAAAPPMMGVGGGDLVGTSGVSMPVIGPELRPGIGTRQYPQSNLVLAGLKRAY